MFILLAFLGLSVQSVENPVVEQPAPYVDMWGNPVLHDPKIPLCSDVTLKKDTKECVVRR